MSLADRLQPPLGFRHSRSLNVLVQAPTGKLALWAVASGLIWLLNGSLTLPFLLAAMLLWPSQRNLILCLGSPWVAYELLEPLHTLNPVAMGSVLAGVWLLLYLAFLSARSFDELPAPFRRHPQLSLHGLLWLALLGLWLAMPGSAVPAAESAVGLALAPALAFLVWRLGYLFLSGQRGSLKGARFRDHAFYLLPAFGGTGVPYGKGHDTLSKARQDMADGLAACQLSGLKLLLLALLWKGVRKAIRLLVYGRSDGGFTEPLADYAIGLMPLKTMMATVPASELTLTMAWPSLLLELVYRTLTVAMYGHVIIGVLRLFGYDVFRNTYKPLLAQTIIEFWNRFHYYFKELLVEFFFYPTYAKVFRAHPRLRIFAAVMASAGLGNLYYHYLRDLPRFYDMGWAATLDWLASRGFYCLLLALGITVSMLREKARRRRPEPQRQPLAQQLVVARRIAGVWLFYALIYIWGASAPGLTFGQRTEFFLALFALQPLS